MLFQSAHYGGFNSKRKAVEKTAKSKSLLDNKNENRSTEEPGRGIQCVCVCFFFSSSASPSGTVWFLGSYLCVSQLLNNDTRFFLPLIPFLTMQV